MDHNKHPNTPEAAAQAGKAALWEISNIQSENSFGVSRSNRQVAIVTGKRCRDVRCCCGCMCDWLAGGLSPV